jgi:pyruvate/2-oxoglutarate dehydrogenase complex dihydrolipoamide acyltransferase (E2) component
MQPIHTRTHTYVVQEGEEFGAGDVLCEVETDKATVDFESQVGV